MAFAVDRGMAVFGFARRHARLITRIGGVLLIAVGLLEVTGAWSSAIIWLRVHWFQATTPRSRSPRQLPACGRGGLGGSGGRRRDGRSAVLGGVAAGCWSSASSASRTAASSWVSVARRPVVRRDEHLEVGVDAVVLHAPAELG